MRGVTSASLSLSARLALWAIRLYQRHLSPLKGFSCAYRVHRGGASCSAYGYRAIVRRGLWSGLRLLNRRLDRCGAVHRQRVVAVNPLLHRQRGDCDILSCDAADACECFSTCDCGDCKDLRERWRRWRARRRQGPPRR